VSFTDDYSKFTWIYLLKFKFEVFHKFQEFQALVERRFNRKILAVQTDWSDEYQKLSPFFTKLDISHHVSCPHKHQQNGSAERKQCHIVETGLSLLAHASIPLKFWDEAFQTATYLINRFPSKIINDSSPLERLFHQTPDYTCFRTFGCACWPHLHPYNYRKLEFRSKQCVFLGYSDMHKGYKCLEVSTGRVYISHDVIFDEEVFPFAMLHPSAGVHLRSEIYRLHPTLFSLYSEGITVQNQVPDDSLCVNPSTELAGENPIQNRLQIRPEQEETDSGVPGTQDETNLASASGSATHLPTTTGTSAPAPALIRCALVSGSAAPRPAGSVNDAMSHV
jgi:hypothetical protein